MTLAGILLQSWGILSRERTDSFTLPLLHLRSRPFNFHSTIQVTEDFLHLSSPSFSFLYWHTLSYSHSSLKTLISIQHIHTYIFNTLSFTHLQPNTFTICLFIIIHYFHFHAHIYTFPPLLFSVLFIFIYVPFSSSSIYYYHQHYYQFTPGNLHLFIGAYIIVSHHIGISTFYPTHSPWPFIYSSVSLIHST